MSIRHFHVNPITREGLNCLEREFERIADKHGVEEPPCLMPTLDDLNQQDEDE